MGIFRGNITFGFHLKYFGKEKKGSRKQLWPNLIIVESR